MAASELHEFNAVVASRPAYTIGGVTSSYAFGHIIDASYTELPNNLLANVSDVNIMNPPDEVADYENETGANMSESTYQTIKGLQSQLANLLNTYKQNKCPCK